MNRTSERLVEKQEAEVVARGNASSILCDGRDYSLIVFFSIFQRTKRMNVSYLLLNEREEEESKKKHGSSRSE